MSLKILLALSLIFITSLALGQDTTKLIRTPYRLSVAVDKKTVYEEEIKATYYVLPNKTIQLYPGETIHVEIDQKDGVILAMTAVAEVKDPTKTITISFSQSSKRKVHEMTMLQIANPFPQDIIYKSKIFLLKQNRWVDTKVIPVRAKLSAFETWPDIITSIAIGDWSFRAN
jgi:hypothetical protein